MSTTAIKKPRLVLGTYVKQSLKSVKPGKPLSLADKVQKAWKEEHEMWMPMVTDRLKELDGLIDCAGKVIDTFYRDMFLLHEMYTPQDCHAIFMRVRRSRVYFIVAIERSIHWDLVKNDALYTESNRLYCKYPVNISYLSSEGIQSLRLDALLADGYIQIF